MFGKSVYLTGFEKENWKDSPAAEVYFTSFHIAEEFSADYAKKAEELLETLKTVGKKIIIDLSPRGITSLGYDSLADFAKANSSCVLRCDFGFTEEEICEAALYAPIGINASTLDYEKAKVLKESGAEVWAIHNFYPRPETGLDENFFTARNAMLKEMGIKLAAFISGDRTRRGPLAKGLPTLEAHRDLPPYVQYHELTEEYGMDLVLLGDPEISEFQEQLIAQTEKDHVLRLPILFETRYNNLYEKIWTIREDSPCWTARLLESRVYATAGEKIQPENCTARTTGTVTIDNERYLRYSGEIQIVRKDLPANENINVIGRVNSNYLKLLDALKGSKKVQFISKE